ncbi:hypothetical protein [Gracilimonas sediminicola]|uniref:Uncharacterized protein n=1 Tax=Gracilimonas sediminicola TaxID=2952158 RepID=A0A9X2L0M2_9BACT|nr:hypothetical protein [Gracilimonas sediminicola]MCP9289989.1 hypothetical protein [Gracilimonas sediminicola]
MGLPLHKRISRGVKKALRAVGKTAGGDNTAGEAIHGVLDWLPVPNQPLGKLLKAVLSGDWNEAKAEVGKLLTVRNVVALLITVPVLMGWVTIDEIKEGFKVFSKILELVNGV